MTKSAKKVCIVAISLGRGGAERSTALLSKMLSDKGFEVHIVIIEDCIDYSYSGKLLNLGLIKNEIKGFWGVLKSLQVFRRFLLSHSFDYVIDNRTRSVAFKEWVYLNYIYKNQKLIYVVRSYNLPSYFPKSKYVSLKMIAKSSKIIGVSKAISAQVNNEYTTNKAETIYNPFEELPLYSDNFEVNEKYIVFLGRFEESVKNFSLLLEAYQLSSLPKEGILLKIIGEGSDREFISSKIKSLNLESNVQLLPFTQKIRPFLEKAYFLTLTSRYEGFPRVLIEALSVGTPVVSVNCKSGPDEIIIPEVNGLLVDNFNPQKLAESFDKFIFDKNLYQTCKANAKSSISHLNQQEIAEKWSKILSE